MAAAADLLTASRIAVVALLLARPSAGAAVLLVAWAWLSDTFDGSLARRAGRPTRLGDLDRPLDAAVGAATAWYLVQAGVLPPAATLVVAVVLLALWVATGVFALQMLFMALANGAFLWWAVTTRASGRWLLLATVAVAVVLERRRLLHELIPTFFDGLAGLGRRRRRRFVP